MLSRNAFNAMLKTLEEPPAHVKFVLATTDPQRVPVTVLSRCLQFNLKQIPQGQIRDRLKHVLDAESVRHEAAALPLLAHAAQGSLRDALSLLDQAIAHGGGAIARDSVKAMLGVVGQEHLHAILRALARRDGAALIAEAARMESLSLSFEATLQDLASLMHRIALAQAVPDAVADDDPDREVIGALAPQLAAEDLQLYYQIAIQGRADLGLAPDERAGFTMTLLRMLAFAPAGQEAGTRAPAAPARAAPESKKNLPADAGWPELVAQLNLTGAVGQLAQHCELTARDGQRLELRIPQAHQHLVRYQDRLKAALEQCLGPGVRLTIRPGDSTAASPAAIADRERQQRQAQAVAAIEQDPFVRELVDTFDGRVVGTSIKPKE
jgi:DNA polymerase-3 subunit gamma/tau